MLLLLLLPILVWRGCGTRAGPPPKISEEAPPGLRRPSDQAALSLSLSLCTRLHSGSCAVQATRGGINRQGEGEGENQQKGREREDPSLSIPRGGTRPRRLHTIA
jgi:hypothetical protein